MSETESITSHELWKKAKAIYISTIQSADEKSQIERYLSTITSVNKVNNKFIIYTSNSYAAEFLKTNYQDKIKKCLELFSNNERIGLEFKYDESTAVPIVRKQDKTAASVLNKPDKPSTFVSTMPLLEEYTFEEFVKGPSNSFALAAAQAVTSNPGKIPGYNPLFIHGGTGLGKTHLMQAIGNKLKKDNPSLAICYLTAEEYLNEYVNNMTAGTLPTFREKYRTIDVLLLDDVQFFQKGKAVQEEFFNTFNALQNRQKQIVMTSDVAPKNLPFVEARLISRCEGGMLQEIESPKYETRLAILKKKAENQEVKVPDKALEFIAEKINSHVRAMEGALSKVCVYITAFPDILITEEILTRLLSDFIKKEQSIKKLTVDEIQAAVAKKFNVTISQILSPERTQSIVTPRQLAMYIARKYTMNSLPEIAKFFDKTHATIIHGVKTIQKRLDVEEDLKTKMIEILSEFGCSTTDKVD